MTQETKYDSKQEVFSWGPDFEYETNKGLYNIMLAPFREGGKLSRLASILFGGKQDD